jgi:nitrate reductase molybdenum cofactor assembly chaperone NarJ/NarW
MNKDSTGLLYTLFADLLSYPSQDLFSITETCLGELRSVRAAAADELEAFQSGIQGLPAEKIEELYTVTFDMQPVCYPYAGYQLFGESYKRGAFMAQLNEAYHAFGYSAGEELPDHISIILRFLGLDAANRKGEFCQTLLGEGVIPALEKMLQAFTESQNPYVRLMNALQLVLTHTPEKELSHA